MKTNRAHYNTFVWERKEFCKGITAGFCGIIGDMYTGTQHCSVVGWRIKVRLFALSIDEHRQVGLKDACLAFGRLLHFNPDD